MNDPAMYAKSAPPPPEVALGINHMQETSDRMVRSMALQCAVKLVAAHDWRDEVQEMQHIERLTDRFESYLRAGRWPT